jgi:Zn ribbon nucleic-acid-binding protein
MATKKCITCACEKDETLFAWRDKNAGIRRGECIECSRQRKLKWARENRELLAQRWKDKYYADIEAAREKSKEAARRYKEKYPDRVREKWRANYWKDPEKNRKIALESRQRRLEQCRERDRRWARENPGENRAKATARRALELRRMPPSLTKEDRKEIRLIYLYAAAWSKATKVRHDVDHILPLQGRSVSGLHVPWNLQIMTWYDNLKKGNRLTLAMSMP